MKLRHLAGLGLVLWASHGLAAAAPPPAPASPPAPAPTTIRVRAAGDIAISWETGDAIAHDGFDPFARLAGALGDADLSFANLETVLSGAPVPAGVEDKPGRPLIRGPARAADVAAAAGLDVVSIANNHAFDLGAAGLADTLAETRRAGLTAIGAGPTAAAAAAPYLTTLRGLTVGMLAFSEKTNHPTGEAVLARLEDAEAAVRALRPKVDVLLVSLHWGVQYALKPTRDQIVLAHALIDAGADAVIGHHPHVLQTVEAYHGHPIFYSLGNFVFGPQPEPRNLSAIVELELGAHAVMRASVLPVLLRGDHGNPVMALGKDGEPVRRRLREASGRRALADHDGRLELVLDPVAR